MYVRMYDLLNYEQKNNIHLLQRSENQRALSDMSSTEITEIV